MSTSKQVSHNETNKSSLTKMAAEMAHAQDARKGQGHEPDLEQILQVLAAHGQNQDVEQLKAWKQDLDWLFSLQSCSHVLIAAIEAGTFSLRYANQAFCRLTGLEAIPTDATGLSTRRRLPELFSHQGSSNGNGEGIGGKHYTTIEQLYRRYLLRRVFQQLYRIDVEELQILDQPLLFKINSSSYPEPRFVEFWLGSEQLKITRIDPKIDEFADFNLKYMPLSEQQSWLTQPEQLNRLTERLLLENYQVEGVLLLEGLDVTEREWIRRLTHLLIDRDSILRPEKFKKINQGLRSLFRAQSCFLLRVRGEEAQLFIGSVSEKSSRFTYSMESLQDSHILHAAMLNQVSNVPDLWRDCQTQCERHLKKLGVRSMLLLPLVIRSINGKPCSEQLLGVVGLTSDRLNNFNAMDCQNAEVLISPFIAALGHGIQQRFMNIRSIHPAVEWRFLQEAERRSWGLPPEVIAFDNVYPLYGICDIRGSSEERNRAIQNDLLEQFHLGLAAVEAFCEAQDSALGQQLRQDILEYIQQIQEKVTVDMEVQATEYLKKQVEINFDYFAECSDTVKAAVDAYKAACDNEHGCVYTARSTYDQMLHQINNHLQETWEHWQERMQKIVAHHCDFEVTDGIDHMLYVGISIDPKFTPFHLRSLRYEQLRAMCDCARTAFRLQAECNSNLGVTHLVLVQDESIDIYHNEATEKLFDVRGSRDIRYEIVKKRIDKAVDKETQTRITQAGMLTIVYSTDEEWRDYQQYLHYLAREGWVDTDIETGMVEPLQGVSGLRFARVRIMPSEPEHPDETLATE